MADVVIWVDIPVKDIERAKKFYGEVLQMPMKSMPGTNDKVVVPDTGDPSSVAFDLAEMSGFEPSNQGARIYFDAKGDMEGMLARAEAAGGKVTQRPQDMGPVVGTVAFLEDTEGNSLGIRQQNS